MGKLGKRLERFILQWRINTLRSDIAVTLERRDNAQITLASTEAFLFTAQRKLHGLKARLALLNSPNALLVEAMRHE